MQKIINIYQPVTSFLICLVFLLFVNNESVHAQQETYVGRPAQDTITNGEAIAVFDTSYSIAVANGNLENLYFSRNKISFHIDESSIHHIAAPFSAKLYLKYILTGYNGDSNTVAVSDTLLINYDTAGNYQAVDYRWFDLVKRSEIQIDSLVVLNGFANAKKLLRFSTEISSFKTLVWDNCSSLAVSNLYGPAVGFDNNAIDTVLVSWLMGNPAMVTEYDLEWTWVDSSAIAVRIPSGDSKPAFYHNATRVTLYDNQYNIPVIYDGGGLLLYRVRPVKLYPDGRRLEGAWTTANKVALSGFQRNLNWQSTVSYAEEGKRKIVLSYFDGSFRNRQTVTKDNTSNKSVVAESIYDFQGRPAIQVLPAPTLSSLLSYSANFTLNSMNSAAYDRLNFDTIINGEAICQKGAEPMGDSSGAARYYSLHNPESGAGLQQYIPQAFGYPFTQTVYSLDNTGRIAAQSGVGPDHKIGLHDTRYYYGKPSQEELIALFGSEAGSASHYQKNMVRDANGQYSVSYVDLHGRTVATALAGNAPKIDSSDRDALTPLVDNRNYAITENLLDKAIQQVEGNKITLSRGILVPVRGDYTLEYSLTPPVLQLLDCNTDTICYDCQYDLNISIISDCGDMAMDTTIEKIGIDTTGGNNGLDSLCNASLFEFAHTIILEEGAYTITKTLKIREDAKRDYYDSIFIANNTCRTYESFLKEEIAAVLDSVSCSIPTCESCITSLGTFNDFELSYFSTLGISLTDTLGYSGEVSAAWKKALENCAAYCADEGMDDISTLRREMLSDMHPPNGQYAIDSVTGFYNVIWPPGSGTADYTTISNYKNALGRQAIIEVEGGLLKQPEELSKEEFSRYFETSWADALLVKHPEYARLTEAERLAASYKFDAQLMRMPSYQQALNAGYITGILNQDPATKNTVLLPTTFKDNLIARLNNPGWGIGADSSVWFMASLQARCDDSTTASACYNDYLSAGTYVKGMLDTIGLCAAQKNILWQSFAGFYTQAKQQLLYERITSLFVLSPTDFGELRFLSNDKTDEATIWPAGTVNESTVRQKGRDMLFVQINEACLGYVSTWLEKLGKCGYDTVMEKRLIDTLLIICRKGGDLNHFAGASSVAPDSAISGLPADFIEAVAAFNQNNGITTDALNCNGYLISNTPAPHKSVGFSQAAAPYIGGLPDSCTCANLNFYRQEWAYGDFGMAKPSFPVYLETRYGSYLTEAEINRLTLACNKGAAAKCDTLEGDVIYVPPFLVSCASNAACADCITIDSLHQKFATDFGYTIQNESYSDSLVLTDTLQIAKNTLYQEFMNYHTGFSYNYSTYLSFLAQCDSVEACHFQDTLLTAFRSSYYRPYLFQPNAAGCNAARWISNYGQGKQDVEPLSNIMDSGLFKPKKGPGIFSNYIYQYAGIDYFDTLCFKPFTFESRMKLPRIGHAYNPFQGADSNLMYTFENVFYLNLKDMANESNSRVSVVIEAKAGQNFTTYIQGNLLSDVSFSQASAATTQPLDDWFDYKLDFTYDSIILYLNNQRVNAHYHAPLDTFNGMYYLPLFASYKADWIKFTDSNGQVVLFEDFDKPCDQMSQIIKDFCQPSCASAWGAYNGDTTIINCTTGDCITLFDTPPESCNHNPCTPYSRAVTLPKLCGNAQPVFPQAPYVPEPPCADSIGLAIQKASMRFTSYKDSLTNIFDSAYTARCLKASENEAFRLIRPQREYHYTLYYYDQAGNLVKTVAPKGVGLFRDSLATTWGFQKDSVGHILDSLIKRVRATELTGGVLLLNYAYATQYRYNSLNQVIAQQTPDAGRSAFWYDTLGRLAISQQSQQKLDSLYSYTLYDVLGRIAEVGEKKQAGAMSQTISRSPAALLTWLNTNHSTQPRRQITRTGYDFVSRPFGVADRFQQQNLRTRVSFSLYQDEDAAELSTISPKSVQPGSVYKQATYYTYDVHGNVNYLLQHYRQGGLFTAASGAHQYKIVRYAYDLISGKVNQVTYQPTWYAEGTAIVPADQYYHRYGYDAENRLTEVYVSRDSVYWERDASYQYYRHGPLARTELGHNRVQGLDYAYTLQGWLKGVNSTGLFRNGLNDDMGKDATPTASPAPGYGDNSLVAEDAFGFALHYNHKDYKPAGGSLLKPFVEIDVQQLPINNQDTGYYQPLYNGNIAGMTTNIPMLTAPIRSGRNYTEYSHFYKYDQLNRLVAAESFPFIFRSTNHIRFWRTITSAEQFSYDANGNFTFVNRNAILPGGAPGSMDILTYNYTDYTNRLTRVKDSRPAGNYLTDIDNQPTNNYAYNAIGNLVSDNADSITRIAWTVYGKIDSIYKSNGTLISYRYDAGGNRILKKVNNTETIYVRDASGNVMSTYTNDSAGLWQKEIHLYGSSRIGIQQIALNLTDPEPENIVTVGEITGKARTFERGNKFFELSNHLGNVLVTVSDRRRSLANTGTPALISRYQPVVLSAQDYLSFGMIMPGRSYESGAYRYGFNGQEKSDEIKGSGNSYTAEFWEYDPRVGRRWNLDPRATTGVSSYSAFNNSPILLSDPYGDTTTYVDKNNKVIHVNMKDKGTDIIRINSIEYENWKTFLEDKKSDKSIIERMGRKSGEKIGRTIFGFDFMNTDDKTGTFTTPEYGTNINNKIPSHLTKGGVSIYLKGVTNGQQLASLLNSEFVNNLTWADGGYFMLKDLRKYSANGELLDIKVTLFKSGSKYDGVKMENDTYTSMRVLGNIIFGMNMASARPASDGKDFFYRMVMPEVGDYNQKQNKGNGYNPEAPFYGEHTLSGSAIFLGYFGKKP
jgi:hypothetical protein